MSANTIDQVQQIEREALELEREFDDKLKQMEKETEQTIAEMKEKVETDLSSFTQEKALEKDTKIETLKALIAKEQEEAINDLATNFKKKEDQLVNAVIEEVMRTYGDS